MIITGLLQCSNCFDNALLNCFAQSLKGCLLILAPKITPRYMKKKRICWLLADIHQFIANLLCLKSSVMCAQVVLVYCDLSILVFTTRSRVLMRPGLHSAFFMNASVNYSSIIIAATREVVVTKSV